jgi:ribonuclease HI
VTTIHIDGGSRGNPGPASFAYVIRPPGQPVVEHAETIGTTTNNVAEYTALLAALAKSLELGLKAVHIHSDSELLVKQMNGEYRVKSADLQDLYQEAQHLRKQFDHVTLTHVRREQNKRADELCNLALDGKPLTGAPAAAKAHTPTAPAKVTTDATVREDALLCLQAAAQAWAKNGPANPPPAAVWEQLWSILEEGNVLKKRK